MKQTIEEIIKKNLPEKKEAGLYTTSKATGGDIINYNREDNDDKREGFNQALSQINTSLIADEVLKVVVEKIENLDNDIYGGYEEFARQGFNRCKYKILQLLTNSSILEDERSDYVSHNKENKNNG